MNGQWTNTEMTEEIVDPLNGETFLKMPSTSTKEIEPFIQSLRQTPKYGLHNPLNNVERWDLSFTESVVSSSLLQLCSLWRYIAQSRRNVTRSPSR